MKPPKFVLVVVVLSIGALRASGATTITINPSDDGALYTCSTCNTVNNGGYVLVSGYIQGIVRFPTAPITQQINSATLTLNPYGLPLWGPDVEVFGIAGGDATIGGDDAGAGIYLGTLHLPPDLGYGQDASFDVTNFLRSVNTDYVGFNLRSPGTDVFSSLEYNYGHPSQLHVTFVPEPATITSAGLVATAFACGCRRRKRRSS